MHVNFNLHLKFPYLFSKQFRADQQILDFWDQTLSRIEKDQESLSRFFEEGQLAQCWCKGGRWMKVKTSDKYWDQVGDSKNISTLLRQRSKQQRTGFSSFLNV